MDRATDVITSRAAIDDALREQWRALANDSGLPYCTPEWMLAFWDEMHAEGGRLALVTVRDADRLIGVGPFYGGAGRSYLSCPELMILGAGIGQRTGPLAAPGHESEVAEAIVGALRGLDPSPSIVSLPSIGAQEQWPELIAGSWPRLGAKAYTDRTDSGPTVSMAASFEDWRAGRSRNFREQVMKSLRTIDKRGGVLRRSQTPEQLDSDLDALFRLHKLRFEQQDRYTDLDEETYRVGVGAAAREMLSFGQARLWVIECDGEVVGAQLHLTAGDRMCYWNGGFDPEWHRQRPGIVLLDQAVRDAHELGMRRLDLGGGSGGYKLRFADTDEPLRWASVLARDARYPLLRGRLAPRHLRAAARKGKHRLERVRGRD